jgi:predicted alpha/beta hydrolase
MDQFAGHQPETRAVAFAAEDGRTLRGRLIAPAAPIAVMVINPATGYRQDFYTAFAEASARQGWAVLVWDYRGQGASREAAFADEDARMLDWGLRDMPAAARFACEAYPDLPLDIVGHSIGGHFVPLIDGDLPLRRVALLSSSSGYWGLHSAPVKHLGWLFWRIVGPLHLALKGHVPRGRLWRGEPLPAGVWKDWRDWGVTPDYFRDTLAETGLLSRYAAFNTPVCAWVADDDPIATPAATRWLLAQFESAPTEMKIVRHADLGRGRIGHDGFFREKMADVFWPQVWRWLAAEAPARAAA